MSFANRKGMKGNLIFFLRMGHDFFLGKYPNVTEILHVPTGILEYEPPILREDMSRKTCAFGKIFWIESHMNFRNHRPKNPP